MLPWQPEIQSDQPIDLMQQSPYLMMLNMKFDQNWPTDIRGIYYFENVNKR